MKAGFDPTGKRPSEFEFYFGPNDFRLLQSVETESKLQRNLIWNASYILAGHCSALSTVGLLCMYSIG